MKKSSFFYFLLFSFIFFLVILISSITVHSDLLNIAGPTSRIVNGTFDMTNESVSGFGDNTYTSFFPPFFYFVDSVVYYPLSKLGIYQFSLDKIIQTDQLLSVSLLLKLRYFIIFILSILVVRKITSYFENNPKRLSVLVLWLFCPVLIFVPFSWGNNDIYPVFFSLLFLLFAFKKKNILAMIFLGLSMSMKNYAIFLVFPAALILSDKNIKKVVIYTFVSLVVYFIPNLFFHEVARTFLTGGGEGLFILQRNVFGGVLLFPLLYFLAILFLLFKQKITDDNRNQVLVKFCFLVLSSFYLTSFYIPQWFLWIMPFFILTAYKDRRLFYLYVIINFAYFMGLFSWGRNLDASLFSVAFPIISKLPTVAEILTKYFFDFKIFEIFNSLFFAGFIAYLYILFFDKENKSDLTEREIKLFSLLPLFAYLVVCLVSVLGLNYFYKLKNRDWYDLGLVSRNELIGPVTGLENFYQTFRSPKDRLKGLNVYFSTYTKKVVTPYQLVLYKEDCKTELRKVDIEVNKIKDNSYKEIFFDEIGNSGNETFCFTIVPNSSEVETPVTLSYSKNGSYTAGNLFIADKKTKDEDVVFQLIYPLK